MVLKLHQLQDHFYFINIDVPAYVFIIFCSNKSNLLYIDNIESKLNKKLGSEKTLAKNEQ